MALRLHSWPVGQTGQEGPYLLYRKETGSKRGRDWPQVTQKDYGIPGLGPGLPDSHLGAPALPVASSWGHTLTGRSCLRLPPGNSALEGLWQGGLAESKALEQSSVLTHKLCGAWDGAQSVAAH